LPYTRFQGRMLLQLVRSGPCGPGCAGSAQSGSQGPSVDPVSGRSALGLGSCPAPRWPRRADGSGHGGLGGGAGWNQGRLQLAHPHRFYQHLTQAVPPRPWSHTPCPQHHVQGSLPQPVGAPPLAASRPRHGMPRSFGHIHAPPIQGTFHPFLVLPPSRCLPMDCPNPSRCPRGRQHSPGMNAHGSRGGTGRARAEGTCRRWLRLRLMGHRSPCCGLAVSRHLAPTLQRPIHHRKVLPYSLLHA
jgi:hypothetical protein